MRIVDLFCGIGGVAEATRSPQACDGQRAGDLHSGLSASVVAAIDIDTTAGAVYAANHGIVPTCQTLESVREIPDADLWWLSPPCQPYTQRGAGLAEADRRSAALEHLIGLIDRDKPAMVAIENVPAFADSAHHHRLVQVLEDSGYFVRGDLLCPTQWGVPMRRRRFYLSARRSGLVIPPPEAGSSSRSLESYLDLSAWDDPSLHLSPDQWQKYRCAINVVDADQETSTAACFTAAYGKSPVRSGSYVRCGRRGIIRRFSPSEIARLMGFRSNFVWPPELDRRARYRLLGNSLCVTIVRALLKSLQ